MSNLTIYLIGCALGLLLTLFTGLTGFTIFMMWIIGYIGVMVVKGL